MQESTALKLRGLRGLSGAQNHRCCYCGFTMIFWFASDKGRQPPICRSEKDFKRAMRARVCTREHFIPKSQGGKDHQDNIIAACAFCNEFRGNAPAEIAFARIQRMIHRGTHPHQVFEKKGIWHKITYIPSTPPVSDNKDTFADVL